MAKRERATNFKGDEKKVLCGLIKEYYHIIENKKTDKITSKQKDAAWEDIKTRHNASAPGASIREVKQLRTFYDNWRRRVKKAYVEEKASRRQTGGGPQPISTLDDADLELLSIIHDRITPLENPFDSNAMADMDEDVDEFSDRTYEFSYPGLFTPKVVFEGAESKVLPSPVRSDSQQRVAVSQFSSSQWNNNTYLSWNKPMEEVSINPDHTKIMEEVIVLGDHTLTPLKTNSTSTPSTSRSMPRVEFGEQLLTPLKVKQTASPRGSKSIHAVKFGEQLLTPLKVKKAASPQGSKSIHAVKFGEQLLTPLKVKQTASPRGSKSIHAVKFGEQLLTPLKVKQTASLQGSKSIHAVKNAKQTASPQGSKSIPIVEFDVSPQKIVSPRMTRTPKKSLQKFKKTEATKIREDLASVTALRIEAVELEVKLMKEKHKVSINLLQEKLATQALKHKYYEEKMRRLA